MTQTFFWSQNFFLNQNIFRNQNFFRPKIFCRLNIFCRPKMNFMKDDLWREKTELLNMRLSKLARAKGLLLLEFDTIDQVLLSKYYLMLTFLLNGIKILLFLCLLFCKKILQWPVTRLVCLNANLPE